MEREWARWVPASVASGVGAETPGLRAEVVQSWSRSLCTVDPARGSAPIVEGGDVGPRWAESLLRGPVTDLAGELRGIADDAGYVAAVTDETGTILWSCGGRVMRRRAEQVNFAPGGRWDEVHMGTNALSLALRTGRPSTVCLVYTSDAAGEGGGGDLAGRRVRRKRGRRVARQAAGGA